MRKSESTLRITHRVLFFKFPAWSSYSRHSRPLGSYCLFQPEIETLAPLRRLHPLGHRDFSFTGFCLGCVDGKAATLFATVIIIDKRVVDSDNSLFQVNVAPAKTSISVSRSKTCPHRVKYAIGFDGYIGLFTPFLFCKVNQSTDCCSGSQHH